MARRSEPSSGWLSLLWRWLRPARAGAGTPPCRQRRHFLSLAVTGLSLLGVLSAAGPVPAWAARFSLNGVRVWRSPDKTRLVLDVSTAVRYTTFSLDNPRRLVLDIKDTRLAAPLTGLPLANTPVKGVRYGVRNKQDLRLVLDLTAPVRVESFLLTPNATYGHRLVVDLFDRRTPMVKPVPVKETWRDIVVAIDAGHGGEDPGAVAYGGGYEKQVTLAIAKKLARLLQKEPGFRPVLIRDGDYYVGLRQRTRIARENNADLFISIHADGFKDSRASGASVFALSGRGATSETARWLAQKENMSDQIGGEDGISLNDKDDTLAGVLLDLSMTSTRNASLGVGSSILKDIGQINRLHKKKVEQAAFVVLKSPDIPSILVEAGFLTNPAESRKLRSNSHQQAVAASIFKGLKRWFVKSPPADSLMAKWKKEGRFSVRSRRYVIQAGDTLSEIADRFDVSLSRLKKANRISRADGIQVGQVLVIPDTL